MNVIKEFNLGRYLPRHSLVHTLDVRVKLVLVPLTVIGVFSAQDWTQLSLLLGWSALWVACSGIGPLVHLRGLKALRYLFLFTVVLHLFLSPGRTLWGIAWLSYDGLLHGTFVVAQLALAVLLSSLLTLTTPPARLALGLEQACAPFHLLGLSRHSGGLLVWVLHFVPILREEAAEVMANRPPEDKKGLLARALRMRSIVAPLLSRLVGRADRLAHALCRGENPLEDEETELPPFKFTDGLVLVLGSVFIAGLLWWR